MGVDSTHLLKASLDYKFPRCIYAQCCNRSDAGDSRMLDKQLLHALQD